MIKKMIKRMGVKLKSKEPRADMKDGSITLLAIGIIVLMAMLTLTLKASHVLP